MTRWGDAPPVWLVRFCVAVIAVGTIVMLAGAVKIGVTVDETFHVLRLRNFLDTGWYLLDDDLTADGRPGGWVQDTYVYAPVATLLLHLPNVVLGNESWSTVSASSSAYVVRHLAVAVLAMVTTAATMAIARVLSGSWRWAAVAGATLVCLPMWTGHAMFNVKDVPVAAGYTLVTLGAVLVLVRRPAGGRSWVAPTLLGLGMVLALGTRPASWPGLAATFGVLALVSILGTADRPQDWRTLRDATLAGLAALVVLALVYPPVFAHPLRLLLGSTSESAGYRGEATRSYLPLMVASTVPVLLLVVAVLGSLARLRRRTTRPRARIVTHDVLLLLVVLQALLLPVALVVRGTSLNGGLRHVLFAAPAVAILVAAGLAQVLSDARGPRSRAAVGGLLAVGLATPLATQVQLFPYAYAYANPLSDAVGLDLPADFWQASLRELADDVPPGTFVLCGARDDEQGRVQRQIADGGQSWLELSQDCADPTRVTVLAPYLEAGGHPPRGSVPVGSSFLALMVRPDAATGCRQVDRVVRTRLTTRVVLSRALSCPLVLRPAYGPIHFDGAGTGAEHLLGGWVADGGARTITTTDRASLGVDLGAATSDIVVQLRASSTGRVRFLLNDVEARAAVTDDGWRVTPGAGGLPTLGSPGNVVLTVLVEDGVFDLGEATVTSRAAPDAGQTGERG